MAVPTYEIELAGGQSLVCAMPQAKLRDLVLLQLANNFGPLETAERETVAGRIAPALGMLQRCFRHIRNKYYQLEGRSFLNPFHAGQYCLFLHFLTRALREDPSAQPSLCDRAYYLNRIMHGVDLFYDAGLPDVFFVEHPLGSCMGRAEYSDKLLFFQGCTVGGRPGEHPRLGRRMVLFAGARVLGRSKIGADTVLSAGASVVNQDVPGNCIVFGSSPQLVFKPLPPGFFDAYFQTPE
jgi:serine O-acetyltransferase